MSDVNYSKFETAIFYMVGQVPSGSFTSIKIISEVMNSGCPPISRALNKAPPGIPAHRALKSERAYFLAVMPGHLAPLAAEGVLSTRIGKQDPIFGAPWNGFTNLPTQRGRDWVIPIPWSFPTIVPAIPAPASLPAASQGFSEAANKMAHTGEDLRNLVRQHLQENDDRKSGRQGNVMAEDPVLSAMAPVFVAPSVFASTLAPQADTKTNKRKSAEMTEEPAFKKSRK